MSGAAFEANAMKDAKLISLFDSCLVWGRSAPGFRPRSAEAHARYLKLKLHSGVDHDGAA